MQFRVFYTTLFHEDKVIGDSINRCNDVAAIDINMGCPRAFSLSGGMGAALELARRIEKTGVDAIAVHGRYVLDRPRDPAKWSGIADVVSALSIPVIANGDVFEYDDFQRIKSATGGFGSKTPRSGVVYTI
ncbi:tRNA-dihydrouridine synthase [Trifolium pratense]|uniref:tRNA-dihydrouridine synthase n=1 Tax=Trifolium pratense TaxID=57577 RepID=A0A2K3N9D1_TRIPR|nr:tRNA-dihydrouridine synthase [Trifolium pratense]